ncbi:hypothetical protein HDE_06681 [Halotydeus destructor]|nr:hypothetical protein HDE_06681 [Halotydeus destructor]
MASLNRPGDPLVSNPFTGVKVTPRTSDFVTSHVVSHERNNTWNIYGFLGLLISVLGLLSWLLVNGRQEGCAALAMAGMSSLHGLQAMHAIIFFAGICICIFGLIDLAEQIFDTVPFYLITISVYLLAVMTFYAAYITYWSPCVAPEVKPWDGLLPPASRQFGLEPTFAAQGVPAARPQVLLAENLFDKMAASALDRDHLGLRHRPLDARAQPAPPIGWMTSTLPTPSFPDNGYRTIFGENDGKMIATFFVDLLNAILILAAGSNFFRRL